MSIRHPVLKVLAVILVATVAVSCAKKKKIDGTPEGDETSADSSISNQEMSFDPSGSDSGSISGLQTVNFPYDSSVLGKEERQRIQGNAEWLKSHPEYNLQIEGHCDAKGSIEYNLALGERRAKAVRSYMSSLGVEPKRLSIISYGKEKPLQQGDSESVYAKNRRANFLPLAK